MAMSILHLQEMKASYENIFMVGMKNLFWIYIVTYKSANDGIVDQKS